MYRKENSHSFHTGQNHLAHLGGDRGLGWSGGLFSFKQTKIKALQWQLSSVHLIYLLRLVSSFYMAHRLRIALMIFFFNFNKDNRNIFVTCGDYVRFKFPAFIFHRNTAVLNCSQSVAGYDGRTEELLQRPSDVQSLIFTGTHTERFLDLSDLYCEIKTFFSS